jgi:PhnB protein
LTEAIGVGLMRTPARGLGDAARLTCAGISTNTLPVGEARADIQPELWVGDGPAAVAFYQQAFGAKVEHRISGPAEDDVVAQLSVDGARFWVSSASDQLHRFEPAAIGGATGRVLLIVDDPESLMRSAVEAGATQMSPVGNEHGWRIGRLVDPFGHEWELGHPLAAWPPPVG